MFAVVQFDNNKNEFSIIPLTWLSDDKKNCFWPKNVKSESQLQSMIEDVIQPRPYWNHYAIKKIHNTAESFHAANLALKLILEESSSNTNEDERPAIQKGIEEDQPKSCDNETYESQNVLVKETKASRKEKRLRNSYSSDSSETSALPSAKRKKHKQSKISVVTYSSDSGTANETSDSEDTACRTPVVPSTSVGPTPSIRGELFREIQASEIQRKAPSPSTPKISQLNQWQISVTHDLEKLKAVQDQQSTMLAQIWQAVQAKNIQALNRPADVPELPLSRAKDFGKFEDWLQIEENFIYMRTRLASIGGTTVRVAVMNMLKFLITNKLGMAFNWAGSAPKLSNQKRKYAFKDTYAYKVINEASKLCFTGKENQSFIVGESTDKSIGQACQDWLKQSKHRYQNSKNQ